MGKQVGQRTNRWVNERTGEVGKHWEGGEYAGKPGGQAGRWDANTSLGGPGVSVGEPDRWVNGQV